MIHDVKDLTENHHSTGRCPPSQGFGVAQLRSLTFHIGMPKTATTALQRFVFPAFPGYVGKGYGLVGQEPGSEYDFHVQARRRALGSPEWRDELADWIARLHGSGMSDVLFSDESLCAWSDGQLQARWPMLDAWTPGTRRRPNPIMEFLQEARGLVGESTDVRTILTVRNQPDFMGSLYAQVQPFLKRPGQADFEAKAKALLAADDPFFDFGTLVEELDVALGSSNCLVLLYEDGVNHNAHQIAEFLGLPAEILPQSVPRANVKSSEGKSWQYRDALPVLKRGSIGRIRKSIELKVALRGGEQRRLRTFLRRIDRLSLKFIPSREVTGASIGVSESLAAHVRAHFATSNARLAERVDRDLLALGY